MEGYTRKKEKQSWYKENQISYELLKFKENFHIRPFCVTVTIFELEWKKWKLFFTTPTRLAKTLFN